MNSISTLQPRISHPLQPLRSPEGVRLREERFKALAALTADSLAVGEVGEAWQERDSPSEEVIREVEYSHRQALHARLRAIDDAIDRVIAGSYGYCSDCGHQIEPKRISADPAISLCFACQSASETEEFHRTL